MSLYAVFCYADLYIIVEYGIFLKKIQFPVQRGANHEAMTDYCGRHSSSMNDIPPNFKSNKITAIASFAEDKLYSHVLWVVE